MAVRTMRVSLLCATVALWAGCSDGGESASGDLAASASAGSTELPPLVLERVELSSSTVALGGAPVAFTAVVSNSTGVTSSPLLIQNRIEQGAARRAAGGKLLDCRATMGELPPGTCTDAWRYHASNAGPGPGTLVPGPATLVVELRRGDSEVRQSLRLPITLR